tara:strand:+ start:794 stop:973 length:180 start_codon:yes stop_codon:yes gene_type:complete
LEIPDKYGINIDIMIEAKMKEQAIMDLYGKYPFLNCKCCTPQKRKKRRLKIVSKLFEQE